MVPALHDAKGTSESGLLVAAFFFGASATVAVFASSKAVRQSHRRWHRNAAAKAYVLMIWAVIVTSIITSLCIWLFLLGYIPPSLGYFVGMLFTWVIQIQCLMQILANRLALIMYNPARARRLKVGLLIAVGIINVSVFCVWVPARLRISDTYIYVNEIWDRIEKVILTIIDVALNGYFMWLVKSQLVAGGLVEYSVLWKYNIVMVCLSISLDIMLIGLMSLPDDAVYVQVHPLVYLTKLNVEMNMAELLGKVVKRSTEHRSTNPSADVWRPRLADCVFDREWLGSAKDFIIPLSAGGNRRKSNGDGGGGEQMHELTTAASSSAGSGDGMRGACLDFQGDAQRGKSPHRGTPGDEELGLQVPPEAVVPSTKDSGMPGLDLRLD